MSETEACTNSEKDTQVEENMEVEERVPVLSVKKQTKLLHMLYPRLQMSAKDRKLLWEKYGIKVKHRERFTPEEDAKIIRNFLKFVKKIKLGDEETGPSKEDTLMLLGLCHQEWNGQERKRAKRLRKLASENEFHKELARGLYLRSIYQVYVRARNILSPLRTGNALTEEDKAGIIQLFKEKGRLWTKIGNIMDCNRKTVEHVVLDRMDNRGKSAKKGPFTEEEKATLVKAIMEVMEISDIKEALEYESIPWSSIAPFVKGRTLRQCRCTWRYLRNQLRSYVIPVLLGDGRACNVDAAKLIYIMYKRRREWTEETAIDWHFLSTKFKHVGPLSTILRWWNGLRMKVPDYEAKSLPQIFKWLKKHHVPSLNLSENDLNEIKEECAFFSSSKFDDLLHN